MQLICFRHPRYDGNGSPTLSCKTCCSLYIATVKAKNAAAAPAEGEWLKAKASEAEQANAQRRP